MNNTCYLNGEMLPIEEAKLDIRDLGFLRGYGVFDVLPVVEVFLTASNKMVLPIVRVDDTLVGDGKVGPVTRKLLGALREFMAAY